MDIDRIESSDREWSELCLHPHTHFFQTPAWSDLLTAHCARFSPFHLLVRTDSRRVIVPMIRADHGLGIYSLFSLPLGTYGGILGSETLSPKETRELIESLMNPRLVKLFLHSRDAAGIESFRDCPGSVGAITASVLSLDLPYAEIEKTRFSANKRKLVNRGRRRGIRVLCAKTPQAIDCYCSLAQRVQEEKKWATRFSDSFCRAMIALPQAEVWTAWLKDRLCCAVVSFVHNGIATAWQGILDRDYVEAHSAQPMNLLYASMIERYAECGLKKFDLGHSLNIRSLEQYKSGFGCTTEMLHRFEWINPLYRPFHYVKAAMVSRALHNASPGRSKPRSAAG